MRKQEQRGNNRNSPCCCQPQMPYSWSGSPGLGERLLSLEEVGGGGNFFVSLSLLLLFLKRRGRGSKNQMSCIKRPLQGEIGHCFGNLLLRNCCRRRCSEWPLLRFCACRRQQSCLYSMAMARCRARHSTSEGFIKFRSAARASGAQQIKTDWRDEERRLVSSSIVRLRGGDSTHPSSPQLAIRLMQLLQRGELRNWDTIIGGSGAMSEIPLPGRTEAGTGREEKKLWKRRRRRADPPTHRPC